MQRLLQSLDVREENVGPSTLGPRQLEMHLTQKQRETDIFESRYYEQAMSSVLGDFW